MKVSVKVGKLHEVDVNTLVIALWEGQRELLGSAEVIDRSIGGLLTNVIRSGDFTGKQNQVLPIYRHNGAAAKRVLLVGLGKKEEFELESVRNASGKVAQYVRELGLKSYVTGVFGEKSTFKVADLVQAQVEGAQLALYSFQRFKSSQEKKNQVDSLEVYVEDQRDSSVVERAIRVAEAVVEGVNLARDIANTPSADMTPSIIADLARKLAEEFSLKLTVLDRNDLEKLGMGGILAVSRGSNEPPKMVVLEYNGGGGEKPVVIVGKGVTFDSGGISIKPSEKMDEMKYDKSGAAAIIGAVKAAALLRLPVNLVAITPLTENLPSGTAFKPGDIVKHHNGKTSEIISTDAEGRLILADALSYASNYDPKVLIDLATLTGACVVALGTQTSGLFTNNSELAKKISQSGESTGERVWELPLWKPYYDQIKSEFADIKNSGGRNAGAITAAAFLANFVKQETPWVHLDIAGTAWTQDSLSDKSYITKGSTGVGVRLLAHFLMNHV